MRLIKLDAIGSTNDFLKNLSTDEIVENFTVVTAENQTNGKGQMGAVWNSEIGKNVIMSVLVRDAVKASDIFNLNIAVAISIVNALENFDIPDLSIKWPNDILSGNTKIGGILIENSFKENRGIVSVIGIGINVNQNSFENLPKASSLKLICKVDFDKEEILNRIVKNLQLNIETLNLSIDLLKGSYIKRLFKKGIPMPFQNHDSKPFMGIIQGVSQSGRLQVLLENETIAEFNIREIKILY